MPPAKRRTTTKKRVPAKKRAPAKRKTTTTRSRGTGSRRTSRSLLSNPWVQGIGGLGGGIATAYLAKRAYNHFYPSQTRLQRAALLPSKAVIAGVLNEIKNAAQTSHIVTKAATSGKQVLPNTLIKAGAELAQRMRMATAVLPPGPLKDAVIGLARTTSEHLNTAQAAKNASQSAIYTTGNPSVAAGASQQVVEQNTNRPHNEALNEMKNTAKQAAQMQQTLSGASRADLGVPGASSGQQSNNAQFVNAEAGFDNSNSNSNSNNLPLPPQVAETIVNTATELASSPQQATNLAQVGSEAAVDEQQQGGNNNQQTAAAQNAMLGELRRSVSYEPTKFSGTFEADKSYTVQHNPANDRWRFVPTAAQQLETLNALKHLPGRKFKSADLYSLDQELKQGGTKGLYFRNKQLKLSNTASIDAYLERESSKQARKAEELAALKAQGNQRRTRSKS